MKLIVCGPLDIRSSNTVAEAVEQGLASWKLSLSSVDLLISSGTQGTGISAERWAIKNSVPVKRVSPDFARYGNDAVYYRNVEMVSLAGADGCLVMIYHDNPQRGNPLYLGPRHFQLLNLCEKKGLRTYLHTLHHAVIPLPSVG